MSEEKNPDIASEMLEIYNKSLNSDDKFIREIIQIESQAKLREHTTRARKEKIKSLLKTKLGL